MFLEHPGGLEVWDADHVVADPQFESDWDPRWVPLASIISFPVRETVYNLIKQEMSEEMLSFFFLNKYDIKTIHDCI